MKIASLVLLMILVNAWPTLSQTSLRVKHFNLEKGLAIQGYDPVAYFSQNKPIKGKPSLEYMHEGVTYRFSSQTNLDWFKQDPQKYEPQYGGWCAYAMGASNEKVEIDPETFKIVNGKLYLFYHSWINNTLLKWNEDEKALRNHANNNWKNTYK